MRRAYSSVRKVQVKHLKNTCEKAHFLGKLQAINLQAWNSTKNELLTYFSRILAGFYVIIYSV